jgi:hypothetical protein
MNKKFSSRRVIYWAILVLGVVSLASSGLQAQGRKFPPGRIPPGQMPPGAQLPPQAQTSRIPPDELAATKAATKTPAGEQFFIVASVDLQKSQILLKRPTEVTLLSRVDDKTRYLDDSGKPIKISDFRAGDTVWVTLSDSSSGPVATRIRKGEMTVADLHRYYLDYPEIK